MSWGEEANVGTFGRKLTSLANRVVQVSGVAIFSFLTWFSLTYTQYMNPLGSEDPINVQDSVKRNLLFIGLAIAVIVGLFLLEKKLSAVVRSWVARIMIVLVSVWTGGCGLWWITAVDRVPVGDQAYVYGGASYFIEGGYFFLDIGGYCSIYPHQLGLIALTEVLFHLVGTYNYFAFQFICVELAVGIVLLGYVMIRNITESMTVAVTYCLFMFACIPLVFYTSWVYGEIPSIFFAMLTACCIIKYSGSGQKRWLVGMVFAVLMAVLVRKNSLIMLIAVCLVCGVYMLARRDIKLFVALLAACLLPALAYSGVYKMYEIRSGFPHMDGVEPISYVAMGMQESNGKNGWYNNYCKDVYYAQEMDNNLVKIVSKQDIKMRLEDFKENPSYAMHFFKEKVLSQWNMPLYQSLYFNSQYTEGHEPAEDSFVAKLNTDYFVAVLGVCDRMQFILYFGLLCYYLFAVKKDSNIVHHMLAVTIIGGFFFSVVWEAKARYIFPYYVTMYPLAAIGYRQAISQMQVLFGRKKKQKSEDNIIPFERVA